MSVNSQTYYVQQYARNINMLVQQKKARLRQGCTEGSYTGKAGSPIEQMGPIEMQPVNNRFAPMGRLDPPTDRRWIYPQDYDAPQLFDKFDKLRILVDPRSMQVQSAVAGANRKIDDVIIQGLFGTAKSGEQGQNSVAFPTSQVVSVQQGATSPTGFTVAKLKAAIKILRKNEAIPDLDSPSDVWCVIGADQHDQLLSEVQVYSGDFNPGNVVMRDGKIDRLMGVNFVHSERLPQGTDDQAGTSTKVGLWQKDGMHFGTWEDIETGIGQREDLRGRPWQAYVTMSVGATRLEEKRVVQIWCR